MNVSPEEKDMLRRLAGEVAEIAALPVHKDTAELWRRLNRLEPVRPLVWINEICWDEMGPDVCPRCTDDFLRGVETQLRQTLFQWRNLPVDMIVDNWIACPMAIGNTGYGVEGRVERTDSDLVKSAVDYIPVIGDARDIERIQFPEVIVDAEASAERLAVMEDIFAGILPVRQIGVASTWFSPWDTLVQWYGIEELYTDMMDRPDLVRLASARMSDAMLDTYEQYEAMGLLSLNNGNNRVGSGGLGITDELPQADFEAGHVRMIDMWGNSAPQIFSGVSPEMHWEFALKQEMRFLDRFGLNCYGCCEPYHKKVGILRRIPRLRRISMSPFVNIAEGAEAIGQDFIYSAKPNPAVLAANTWNPAEARANLAEILEKTRGLHVEIILKDIHTVRGERQRLFEWSRIAREMVEEYAS